MNMKKILLMAAAVGFIAQATPVFAEHHEGHGNKGDEMFAKHDTNGDGKISEAEFLAHMKSKFAEKDTNKDGSISKDEAKAAHEAKREEMKAKRGEWKEKRKERMEAKKPSEEKSAE
jgi:polyhydroxyalkanoate synthesis regulator phasin